MDGLLKLSPLIEKLQALTGDRINILLGRLQRLTPPILDLMMWDSYYSDAQAEKDFGYKPIVSLEDGVRLTQNFFASIGAKSLTQGGQTSKNR